MIVLEPLDLKCVSLSSRGESESCLATFVERKSFNHTSNSMEKDLDQFFNKFNSSIKSITTDHGREVLPKSLF